MAEVIVLPVGIPGVGRKGDYVVSDPDHPNPKCRLARFGVLDPALLLRIKKRTTCRPQKEKSATGGYAAPTMAMPSMKVRSHGI